jgi:hypothetical protein
MMEMDDKLYFETLLDSQKFSTKIKRYDKKPLEEFKSKLVSQIA